jgi:pimeloyl-ACP methyl ester carboxylesterase
VSEFHGQAAERSAVIAGVPVRYHVSGTTVGSASPIVLVHGLGGSTRSHMSYLLPMLARRRRVISVDFSAPTTAGQSDLKLGFLIDQIAGVITQEVPGVAVGLLGYSLGAVVAAALAGTRTDLIDRLVLVNGWLRTDGQQALRTKIWQTLRAEGSSTLLEFMTFCAFSGEILNLLPPADVERIIASLHVDTFVDQQIDLASRIDIAEQTSKIVAPTLVIGSRGDQMAPPRHSRALFGVIEDARYLEVTAGHAVLHERVAEVLRAAEGFFDAPAHYAAGTVIQPLQP